LQLFAAAGLAASLLAGVTASVLAGRVSAAATDDDDRPLDPMAALDHDIGVALFDARSDAIEPGKVVLVRVSANFRHVVGLPADAKPGIDGYLACVHADDLPWVAAEAERVTREGGGYHMEHRVIAPAGAERWLAASGSVTDMPDGGRRMLGVITDITTRKVAERRLSDSETRLRLAVEAAELGVWEANIDSGQATWSPRMLEMHGLDPAGGTPDYAARSRHIHPEDRPAAEAMRVEIWQGHGPVEYTYRVGMSDGTLRHLRGIGRRVQDVALGINRVAGIVIDETARFEVTERLADSEARARFAADAAGLGVFAINTRTGQATWSDRMWDIYGLQRSFVPTTADAFFERFIHPEDRAVVAGTWHAVRPGAKTKVIKGEFRAIRADGAIVQIQGSFIIPAASDPNAHFIYGFHQDVTETRALRAQAIISGNLATLGQLAAGIAHEIGQPLHVITLATSLATHHLRALAPDVAASVPALAVATEIERIGAQVERASAIIGHLLAFSRGESSGGTTTCAAAVAGALELVRGALHSAGIKIAVDVAEGLPTVHGGQVELEQVLVNLFFNARDAMAGRPERRLVVRAQAEAGGVALEVEDTGGGISPTLLS
ncbi:MAG: PAS domain-containing protein, partial [Alphaproteobacteria bacterium]|nr:PAS domain-containing protein [Alphaproteobacteria bacterium]